jgi:hypothetical protein
MATKKKTKKKPAKATKKPAAKKPAKKPAKKAAPRKSPAAGPNPWKAYAAALAREAQTTLKVMRAFPADQHAFQPHPRSQSAVALMSTFTIEQALVTAAINGTFRLGGGFPPPFASVPEAIAAFDSAVKSACDAANSAPAHTYSRPTEFFVGPKTPGMVPAGALAEMMLGDQIHHRGQLSVYVRMAGGKVPSIYGPSADEPWN